MQSITVKYYLLEYLYRVIDNDHVFEYDWTADKWRFCRSSTILYLHTGTELSEEEAIKKAKEYRTNLANEPYTRKYAISSYFSM